MWSYKNFTLDEFVRSATAERLGIENSPSWEDVLNLDKLVDRILQPLRTAWGRPINVTSGFRCSRLNKAVGGVATSAHLKGNAADIQPSDMREFDKFTQFIASWIQRTGIRYDQIIIERSGNSRWVHIGLQTNDGGQRMHLFNIVK